MREPVKSKHRRVQRGSSTASVSIHVRNLAQMFNSLDPSPFWDRDLAADAAQFIEEEFGEKLSADFWHLNVHTQEGAELASDVQAAVEHYYERLAHSARRRLHDQMRVGRLALLGGLAVFLLSMSTREIVHSILSGVPRMFDEGLIILAWLALWRPIETLLYEWVPLVRKRRLYERLAGIRVLVRAPATPEGAATSREERDRLLSATESRTSGLHEKDLAQAQIACTARGRKR